MIRIGHSAGIRSRSSSEPLRGVDHPRGVADQQPDRGGGHESDTAQRPHRATPADRLDCQRQRQRGREVAQRADADHHAGEGAEDGGRKAAGEDVVGRHQHRRAAHADQHHRQR